MIVSWMLVIVGPLALTMCAATLSWVYVSDKRDKRKRIRTKAVAAIYGRRLRKSIELSSPRTGDKRYLLPGADWALRLIRVRTSETHIYPLAWWMLLSAVILVSTILCVVLTHLVNLWVWIALPALVILFSRALFGLYHHRRQTLLYEQIPDALAMIVRAVRAGLPVTEALRTVSDDAPNPTAQEFTRVVSDLALGVSLHDALVTLAARTTLQEYRFFAVALGIQSQAGGNLAETLENLAEVVRKRVALRARAIALAAEARMTAYVLVALPFLTGAALAVIAPTYLMILFVHPQGRMMLFLALGLLAAGVYTMRSMIRSNLQ